MIYKPNLIIDVATLTGACLMGLGDKIGGFFTNDENLSEKLSNLSKKSHELLWRLPLSDGEIIKST